MYNYIEKFWLDMWSNMYRYYAEIRSETLSNKFRSKPDSNINSLIKLYHKKSIKIDLNLCIIRYWISIKIYIENSAKIDF